MTGGNAIALLWRTLRCPACGVTPDPARDRCSGCTRVMRTPTLGLDMLGVEDRASADEFLAAYAPLRRREGWTDREGIEDPDQGGKRHWRNRRRAAARLASLLRENLAGRPPFLVADVGAGGGWLARLLPYAAVAALDLGEPPVTGGADLRIRADMRRMPFQSGTLDATAYCAALHYAPVPEVLSEAARVLRPGGILISVETPIYPDEIAAGMAGERSRNYFEEAGAAVLSMRYHPVAQDVLRASLRESGFEIVRLDQAHHRYGPLRMMRGAGAFPVLIAKRRN